MYFKKVVSILVICVVAGSALAEESKPEVAPENVLNELSWSCANNASCVTRLARKVVQKLATRKPVDFGAFAIEPVERIPLTVEGRSSRALDFLSGNAVKFPIGPMVFNIERSADYPNFIEVSLLRKADGAPGARGKTRKHMRFFVPAFLVFSQIGWYALAIAGVKLLAIKAFLVAKIALIVVAMMTFKKLMEPVAVLPSPYFDHQEPFLMPYSMDFHHGFPGAGHDMYPIGHLGHHDGPSALHAAEGGLGAASNVNAVVDTNQAADKSATVGGSSSGTSSVSGGASAAASSNDRHHFPGGKIKRQDFYPVPQTGKYY
ncbi:uncharacterized protein LOC120428851 [Culex pipiens pallens]|uniref:uncharacterized protein LOC120428851 n=1 Tax=Culex pipiens pallens TaxID=42434 RepID=UPI0019547274|nr:uncharacterized protein LOC120428851 [Culex pipiens pallens]